MNPRQAGLLLAAALAAGRSAPAQEGWPAGEPGPRAAFAPLSADPKEPAFFATYLWARAPDLASRLGTVGFGQTVGLIHGRDWQLAVAAGVFSQFNLSSATADLMNTDYLIGLPFTYRRGALATRVRLYHQSSHLGDEYMVHAHAQRVDLSFEAAELLVSHAFTRWRVYGGGEYLFTRSPADLQPGVLHGGVEYRPRGPLLRLGRFATGSFLAALDTKSFQDRGWQVGWSFVTGLELADPAAAPTSGWRWSVLLKAYSGPAPYGEFFRDGVTSLGLGLGLTL